MHVIERGRPQKGWSKQKRCTGSGNGDGGCGALLLVEESDIFRTESHVHMDTDAYATFQCSECGVKTDFDDDEVPGWLWEKLKLYKEWRKARGDTE